MAKNFKFPQDQVRGENEGGDPAQDIQLER